MRACRNNMEALVVTVRETLENTLGAEYARLPENDRINIQICMMYKMAEQDENIMGMIGDYMYESLRGEL